MSDTLNIFALILSPAIAVVIGETLRRRNFSKQRRLEILNDLIAYRNRVDSQEFLEALNSVILFFPKNKKIKELLGALHIATDSARKIQLLVSMIKCICDEEKFVYITEEDITKLFKKN